MRIMAATALTTARIKRDLDTPAVRLRTRIRFMLPPRSYFVFPHTKAFNAKRGASDATEIRIEFALF